MLRNAFDLRDALPVASYSPSHLLETATAFERALVSALNVGAIQDLSNLLQSGTEIG